MGPINFRGFQEMGPFENDVSPKQQIFCVKTQRSFAQKAEWTIRHKTLNAALNLGLDLICYCQQSNKLKHSFVALIFSGDSVHEEQETQSGSRCKETGAYLTNMCYRINSFCIFSV